MIKLLISIVLSLTAVLAAFADEKPVAVLNGKPLSEAEFHRRCERLVGGETDTAVGIVALKDWVQQTLAEEEATRKHVLPSDQEVDRRVKCVRKQFEFKGVNFDEWLADHGRTLVTLRDDTRGQLIAEKLLTEGVTVTDVEVLSYYTGNKQLFGVPEQLKVSRITLDDRKAAQEVEAALKKGGSFEELAKKHSLDPYKEMGGKVPDPVDADPKTRGPLEPEVLAKALGLEVGKFAGPIKVADYWVFVRVDGKTEARAPEFADVRDLIEGNMRVQKAGPERLKAAQDRLNKLAAAAKLEINRPEYQGLIKQLQSNPATTAGN